MIKRLMLGSAMSAIILATLPFYSPDAPVNAQRQHFVSTKAGLVSRVRGQVFVERATTKERERAAENLQMMDGDLLTTSADSRVEILINPQAYLRLDEQAEVRAINTVIAEARFELVRGTAIVEVNRLDKGIAFELVTPQGMVAMSKEGFYRISLEPAATRIDVIEGEIALGTRQEALSKTAVKIGDGKRVELKSDAQATPVVTALERKTFDEFDRWSFQVAKYGVVARLEAGVYTACRDKEQNELCRIFTQFQLKDDEWLITNADSYVELRLNRGVSINDTHSMPRRNSGRSPIINSGMSQPFPREAPMPSPPTRGGFPYPNFPLPRWLIRETYLCLNQQTQLHAVKTETDDSVFELRSGSVIIVTDRYARMRPLKIMTPDGTFAIERGCIARFDVNPPQTIVSVRQGEVRLETRDGSITKNGMDIGRGKRLRLSGGAPPRLEGFKADFKMASLDAFDRWSFRLVTAGYVTRYDGKVFIQRQSGTKLELDRYGSKMQVQLWEGDRLLTAPGAHAEVLLSSKAVLHVNEESEIRAVKTSLPTPRFELLRGAAYLHHLSGLSFAYRSLWTSDMVYKKTKVEISTPHGFASISEGGKYRFEIDSSGTTIKVHDGSLSLGVQQEAAAKAALKVKEKETVHLASTNARRPEIAKLAASPPDDFDQWSTRFLQSLDIFRRIANFSTPDTAGLGLPGGPAGIPGIRF